ncbi:MULTISPECIES: hypothetical protein [Treponema]|uniref:Uncharacterized protein n=6 Tax=Treponema TaxID=157 RepID=O83884_TREPA|nr:MULTISPECIES: hypothetical protein [Treponema]AAC65871.1 conserved hypothetical protein [Treponema pallidum subsp. pallidum str. Nichols]ACD71330.1 hypothetical protein TPASS_0914 [Treponema pallidum subsp. pallidum SS14]ADD73007.1 conserved hypothetical protein [Treponema pallidum subsp. pallidum str. Chicago]AEH40839.1 conserved hypothetical protein [Treponema paraluiscuniculi Cuniculi A]AEZ58050.1 hypothetical protein TPESAMD_0914 [Treponema pallidum subsp. pertenue str. SamoaD]
MTDVQSSGRRRKRKRTPRRDVFSPKLEFCEYVCPRCKEVIKDLPVALGDKDSGRPVHFDCVLSFLRESECLAAHEHVVYVGQGKFAVIVFPNPASTTCFSIVRLIEWETKNTLLEWRAGVAKICSQVS